MSMSCVNAARRVAGGKGTDAERSQCARFLRFGGIRSVRLSLFAEGYHKGTQGVLEWMADDSAFFHAISKQAKRDLPH